MFALILYYISFYLEKLVTSADSPLSPALFFPAATSSFQSVAFKGVEKQHP